MDLTLLSSSNTRSVRNPQFRPRLPTANRQSTTASWTNAQTLPEPPSLPGLDEELPTPSACALHFIDDGKLLVVSYVDHGIVYAYHPIIRVYT